MFNTTDLYLGTFLILCGFALSLFNLKRVVKGGVPFSSVLLSENILLMCIGLAFVGRSVYSLNPTNVDMYEIEERTSVLTSLDRKDSMNCGFSSLLLGYGPLVVSMVNSFLTLIIDNYMHYRMLGSAKEKVDENVVHDISIDNDQERKFKYSKMCNFCKKYFSFLSIAAQWLVPFLFTLAMYPMGITEMSMSQARDMEESCMALLDFSKEECNNITITNSTVDIPKYIQSPVNFLEAQENIDSNMNNKSQFNSVLNNVLRIINGFNNHTNFTYAGIKSLRKPKMEDDCMKMCFTDNKSLLLYMFILAFVSYFVPITISTIILTKIHVMDVKKPMMKTHVRRELLYNILFWTPVMFDTFLSLIFCSYSTHTVRTSMFSVIANIYQAIKNFMNTKYFKENVVVPV